MSKKTKLLEYVVLDATKMAEEKSKRVTANYIVLSLLKLAKKNNSGSGVDVLSTDEARAEFFSACSLLGNKMLYDLDKTIEIMTRLTEASKDRSLRDELEYHKCIFTLQTNESIDLVTTPMLLKELLEGSTNALKECMNLLENSDEVKAGKNLSEEDADLKRRIEEAFAPLKELSDTDSDSDKKDEEDISEYIMKKRKEILEKLNALRGTASGPSDDDDDEDDDDDDDEDDDDTSSEPDTLKKIIDDSQKLQRYLLDHIFGQDHAINVFVSGYFQSRVKAMSEKNKNKPKATFLFAGPPGTGKTFLSENVAQSLNIPYKRFDMSSYSSRDDSVIAFRGINKSYKAAKEGQVTSFVARNPKCVLLFDEIEKAHISVILLFLQILDEGILQDEYTEENVSFADAIIMFTTNAGKNLYNETEYANLSSIPKKKIIKALETDKKPDSDEPLFPQAICSRFAAGNVVMFNRLEANNLLRIANRELVKNSARVEKSTGIKVNVDSAIAPAILFSEGGNSDGRMVTGRTNSFFYDELYELFRLLSSERLEAKASDIKEISIDVSLENCEEDAAKLFSNEHIMDILVFSNDENVLKCKNILKGITCHMTDNMEQAKDILFNNDISLVLADIYCNVKNDKKVLNAEDMDSDGIDFVDYVLNKYNIPTYLVQGKEGKIADEEFLSFAQIGVKDIVTIDPKKQAQFEKKMAEMCEAAYQEQNVFKLTRENKLLSYKTAQTVSDDGKHAHINLYDLHLATVTDLEDDGTVMDNRSRPTIKFDRVIGAQDAKDELRYFVEYLKDPIKYMRKGVAAPKGVLLYGPPGTGKTMLAKATAGESGVTFFAVEGNEFRKKYIGEGSEAVHKLFRLARKYAPSIIFIDEIDAIGIDRSLDTNNTSAPTLTTFLAEMDGFKTDTAKPVFVLAATNYGIDEDSDKRLDPALLRRFDRRIYVDLPNKDERREFLKMKLADHTNITLSNDQIENICVRSTGMSLAELDSVFELALRAAIRADKLEIDDEAFEEAFETFNSGEKKQWSDESVLRTARHEAGHALISWLSGDKPSYLTIVSRGNHGGYMQHGESNKGTYTRVDLRNRIRTSLGGRAAELVYYGNDDGVSTGPSADLRNATSIAERMICDYGMDEVMGLACIDYNARSANYEMIRSRINQILLEELQKARELISKHQDAMDKLIENLLKHNQLREKEIDDILKSSITE